jgi:hypothetical protein
MKLVTNLSDSAFRLARRVLEAAGLFVFRRLSCGSDGRTSVWEVKNLHGARVKDFWQSEKNEVDTASNKADNISIKANTATNETNIITQNQSEQGFGEHSRTPQKHLTNSSKEFVRCDSSTLLGNSRVEVTADASLGGASPPVIEGVEEAESLSAGDRRSNLFKREEESPAVTDCTSLTLVDAAPSQSASLLGEKQDSGVEATVPHEDTFSAVPVASIVENPSQLQNQAQPNLSVSLTADNCSELQT